jgi:small conductance mechanosensitive channel
VVFSLVTLVLAFPALDIAGVELAVGLRGEDLARWGAETGVRTALLLLLAFGANRAARTLIARAEREMLIGEGPGASERQKRAATLASSMRRFVAVLIWTISGLVVLRELDVDISPILTGAGILGLAVGFGAQTLVRDIISGIFLIAEDQVRVGDVAVVNGIGGLVEQINLRTIVLRDLEGTVHLIPNGEIRTLANRTKDYAWFVLEVGVDYDGDTDAAVDAVRAAASELQADPVFGPFILEPLEVLGVESFGASAVGLRFRIKTLPLKQWDVGRELRRRVKRIFDARGIRIPVQQVEVTIRGGTSVQSSRAQS